MRLISAFLIYWRVILTVEDFYEPSQMDESWLTDLVITNEIELLY